ncbi:50S ribosomal protein L3 [Planctomycetota bacterium]
MIPAILGRKLGMTQMFNEDGALVPVTVLQVGPCQVTQIKTMASDKYAAVQIGFEEKKKNVNMPATGHFSKSGVSPKRFLREVRLEQDPTDIEVGNTFTCEIFAVGERVDVSGRTKGKGFAGTIKRWNFTRGPVTHGSMNVRRPGSIGQCAYPGKVFKGKKMPGHMGDRNFTQRGLTVVKIDAAKNVILVKGSVPGCTGGFIKVRRAVY